MSLIKRLADAILTLTVAAGPWTAIGYFAEIPAWAAGLGGGAWAFLCGAFLVMDHVDKASGGRFWDTPPLADTSEAASPVASDPGRAIPSQPR